MLRCKVIRLHLLSVVLVFAVVMYIIYSMISSSSLSVIRNSNWLQNQSPPFTKCKALVKWAVTNTDAQQPSSALLTLLNQTRDLCVLVMGANNTIDEDIFGSYIPRQVEEQFIYMSEAAQDELPYPLVHNLRGESTSSFRRNLGHLHAIANGAQVIIDLHDNVVPILVDGTYLPVREVLGTFRRGIILEDTLQLDPYNKPKSVSTIAWNPFPEFGAVDDCPRGFPNDLLLTTSINFSAVQDPPTFPCRPIVQHYISNCSASFVNTVNRKHIVAPRAVLSPYDAQSTVHLYSAFWSLFLPPSVGDDLSDVVRSYIAQSLFYLIPNACLMFTPHVVTCDHNQLSSKHTIFNTSSSRKSEHTIYMSQLIETIHQLPLSLESDSFEEALQAVYNHLYLVGVLGKQDVDYLQAWIQALTEVGYQFPLLPQRSTIWSSTIKLCVMFNHLPSEQVVRLLLTYYIRFFRDISLFIDGEWPVSNGTFDYVPEAVKLRNCNATDSTVPTHILKGGFQQNCLAQCLAETSISVDGYLYIADDMFLNLSMLEHLPRSKVWKFPHQIYTAEEAESNSTWPHWSRPTGYRALLKVIAALPPEFINTLHKNGLIPSVARSIVDFVYIPKRIVVKVLQVLSLLQKTDYLFCEAAVPLVLNAAAKPHEQHVLKDTMNIWGKNRTNMEKIRSAMERKSIVHPVKLSQWLFADLWREKMSEIFQFYLKYS